MQIGVSALLLGTASRARWNPPASGTRWTGTSRCSWCPPWVRHQHLTHITGPRFVEGKLVIDAACGTGYGPPSSRPSVVPRPSTDSTSTLTRLQAAKARCASSASAGRRLRYRRRSQLRATSRSRTIEHLPRDEACQPSRRVLAGRPPSVLDSTGAGSIRGRARRPAINPFHVREYDRAVRGRLARFFGRPSGGGLARAPHAVGRDDWRRVALARRADAPGGEACHSVAYRARTA